MRPQLLFIDPLTGVYTRANLHQRLQEEIERAARYDESFSLLLVDLDYFKSINDAFGYSRGDEVLAELAKRLQDGVRGSDILFRYGGDEFILLLPNTAKPQATALAERLLDAIQSSPFGGRPPVNLSLSIGVANFPGDGSTAEAIFEAADIRNHEAKRQGRGRVVGDSPAPPVELSFGDTSRLVERDEALRTLMRFLDMLPEGGQGILQIGGPAGSGRSCFLAETARMARLRGYQVIALHGGLAVKNRVYGAIARASKELGLPSPSAGIEAFGEALRSRIEDWGRTGVFITADNLFELDWATLELVYHLIFSSSIPTIGLAYALDPEIAPRVTPLDQAPLRMAITLAPLSESGLRIWLRSLLQWECPPEFITWLYQNTQGLPAEVQKVLPYLVERGILRRTDDGWRLSSDFDTHQIPGRVRPGVQNLPIPPSPFIGRDRELSEVQSILATGRMLTLIGPGGVGKTRLAIQAAAEMAERFPHGVFFVPLASTPSPEFLTAAIAEALGFSFYSQDNPQVQLINYLREKHLLLIFDNFEHLVAGAGILEDILASAPNVKLLVTSRVSLDLHEEMILEIRGMEYPQEPDPAKVEIYPAVQMFLQSARRVQPTFTPTEEDRAWIVKVCQSIDGSPLGIELASAWLRMLSCQEIAREMEKSLDFVATTKRNIPERHRSLRAVFESSWNLLAQDEKTLFARLAIFQGSFDREAAASVAGASLSALSALAQKSLLHRTPASRYSLHEVLKQYAAEKLAEMPEEQARMRQAHCDYYTEFLHQREETLKAERQKVVLAELTEEIDNLRAAWAFATEHEQFDLVKKAYESLYRYYEIHGLHQEGVDAMQRAVEAVKNSRQAIACTPTGKLLLANLQIRQGIFNTRMAHFDTAWDLYTQSKDLIADCKDTETLATLYLAMGTIEESRAHYSQAEEYCRLSYGYYESLGDQRGMAYVLNEASVVAYFQGNYAESKKHQQAALSILREMHDPWGISRTLINGANADAELGNFQEAVNQYEESLAIGQALNDRSGVSVLMNNLGDTARLLGNLPEAKRLIEQSVEICREIGDRYGAAVSLNNLADIAYVQGDYGTAELRATESLSIYQEIHSSLGTGYSCNQLSAVAVSLGQNDRARHFLRTALQSARDSNSSPLALETIVAVANLMAKQGQTLFAKALLLFASDHPAGSQDTEERAARVNKGIEGQLSPDEEQIASEKARSYNLETVINDLLKWVVSEA